MKLSVDRHFKGPKYTIGRLYVDGVYECDTLEDVVREKKIPNETAIPAGTYRVAMDVVSPRFGGKEFFKRVCGGKLPRLLDVPGFEGVLIHTGNTADDSSGCLLVGKNTVVGMVTDSKSCFEKLYNKMKAAHDKGEAITITLK